MTVAYIKALLEDGPFPRHRASDEARWRQVRKEALGHLSEPGCAVCRHEQVSLGRFFFWYLHEGYFQVENIQRMQRSHGFCHRHTKSLLAEGASRKIVSIYAPLISAAVEDLRRVDGEASATPDPRQISAGLASRGTCPACASEARGRSYLLHLLQATLHDAEVRDAVRESSAVCLLHSLEITGSLDWGQSRFLVEEAIGRLRRFKDPETSGDRGEPLMEEIRGADLDEPYQAGTSQPRGLVGRRTQPDAPAAGAAEDKSLTLGVNYPSRI